MIAWGYMLALSIAAANWDLACAIENVARENPPLFVGDADRRKTIAVLTAIAWRESAFKIDAVGDHGRSVGAFQRLNGPRLFLTDARSATVEALRQVRESFGACSWLPVSDRLALYARGNCRSERGRELSRDRMRLAVWLWGSK